MLREDSPWLVGGGEAKVKILRRPPPPSQLWYQSKMHKLAKKKYGIMYK
jgi:hypothetical protein